MLHPTSGIKTSSVIQKEQHLLPSCWVSLPSCSLCSVNCQYRVMKARQRTGQCSSPQWPASKRLSSTLSVSRSLINFEHECKGSGPVQVLIPFTSNTVQPAGDVDVPLGGDYLWQLWQLCATKSTGYALDHDHLNYSHILYASHKVLDQAWWQPWPASQAKVTGSNAVNTRLVPQISQLQQRLPICTTGA